MLNSADEHTHQCNAQVDGGLAEYRMKLGRRPDTMILTANQNLKEQKPTTKRPCCFTMAPTNPANTNSSPPPTNNNSNNKKYTMPVAAQKKSIDRTVFVRFLPPSPNIRRHHLEDLFSQIGPIKKSSVIHSTASSTSTSASSYGFVKYTSQSDAETAAQQLNGKTLVISETETVQVKVELATTTPPAPAAGGRAGTTSTTTSRSLSQSKPKAKNDHHHHHSHDLQDTKDQQQLAKTLQKKQARVILRNLAFRAKEAHVRQALEERFGPIVEIHLPMVRVGSSTNDHEDDADQQTKKSKASSQPQLHHRGFCFVTFEHESSAAACIQAGSDSQVEPILIHHRPVSVAWSLHKTAYEQQKLKTTKQTKTSKETSTNRNPKGKDDDDVDDDQDDDDNDDSSSSASSADHDNEDHEDSENDNDDDEDSEKDNDITERKQTKSSSTEITARDQPDFAVFVRNLPFDVTRHDVFDALHKFGHINSIYLVKSPDTGLLKGTAFVHYATKAGAERALTAASPNNTATSGTAGAGGVVFRGRTLLLDWAVDKETANVLSSEKQNEKATGKDRRFLYLKGEGRVERVEGSNDGDDRLSSTTATNVLSWDALPVGDQEKRQRAWSEKLQKLKSPLFFINPVRLSVRNLAKHVTESSLKHLVAKATQRGLERHLVTAQDQIAHWKAQGELTTREILARIKECEQQDPSKNQSLLPPFEMDNIKKHVTSVFIDRDMEKDQSRGFAFIEFQHHVHALACLRELNNNPKYSEEYVQGGMHATKLKDQRKHHGKKSALKKNTKAPNDFIDEDGVVKIPRLIVEFTVENKAKAKLQAEHRAKQESNMEKQKMMNREKAQSEKKEKKKKSRGALQREKKRKEREKSTHENPDNNDEEEPQQKLQKTKVNEKKVRARAVSDDLPPPKQAALQPMKPPKKKKVDKSEAKFTKLVESYKKSFSSAGAGDEVATEVSKKKEKRWFE